MKNKNGMTLIIEQPIKLFYGGEATMRVWRDIHDHIEFETKTHKFYLHLHNNGFSVFAHGTGDVNGGRGKVHLTQGIVGYLGHITIENEPTKEDN